VRVAAGPAPPGEGRDPVSLLAPALPRGADQSVAVV
jgi:hypothetical protein